MGRVGFEPTNSEESGFTVRRNWPTMRPALYKMIFSGLSVTSVKSTVASSLRVTITVVSSDCAQHYSYVGVMLPYRLGLGTENPHPVLWHNYQSRTCSSTDFLLPVCFSAIGLFVIGNNSNASCTCFIGW